MDRLRKPRARQFSIVFLPILASAHAGLKKVQGSEAHRRGLFLPVLFSVMPLDAYGLAVPVSCLKSNPLCIGALAFACKELAKAGSMVAW